MSASKNVLARLSVSLAVLSKNTSGLCGSARLPMSMKREIQSTINHNTNIINSEPQTPVQSLAMISGIVMAGASGVRKSLQYFSTKYKKSSQHEQLRKFY